MCVLYDNIYYNYILCNVRILYCIYYVLYTVYVCQCTVCVIIIVKPAEIQQQTTPHLISVKIASSFRFTTVYKVV